MTIAVSTVRPDHARVYWPHIEPVLARALEYGWNTTDEVLGLIEQAKAQCWLAIDDGKLIGVWVTKIEQSARGRFCLLWLGAGERSNEWLPLIREYTEPWARENGCNHMQVVGRKGWVKKLPDYKWTAIVLRKEL